MLNLLVHIVTAGFEGVKEDYKLKAFDSEVLYWLRRKELYEN
jgi:hypothetical protein